MCAYREIKTSHRLNNVQLKKTLVKTSLRKSPKRKKLYCIIHHSSIQTHTRETKRDTILRNTDEKILNLKRNVNFQIGRKHIKSL